MVYPTFPTVHCLTLELLVTPLLAPEAHRGSTLHVDKGEAPIAVERQLDPVRDGTGTFGLDDYVADVGHHPVGLFHFIYCVSECTAILT